MMIDFEKINSYSRELKEKTQPRDNTQINVNNDLRYKRPRQSETNRKAYRTINPEASTSWLDSGAWKNALRFLFDISRSEFGEKKNEDMFKFYLNGARDTTSIPDLREKPKNFSKLKHPTYKITDDDMYRINKDIISRDTNALKEDINSSDQRQLKAIRESHFNRNMGNDEEADRYKDEAERLRLSKEWKVQLLDSLRKFSKDPTKYMTFNEAYTNPSTWIPNENGAAAHCAAAFLFTDAAPGRGSPASGPDSSTACRCSRRCASRRSSWTGRCCRTAGTSRPAYRPCPL